MCFLLRLTLALITVDSWRHHRAARAALTHTAVSFGALPAPKARLWLHPPRCPRCHIPRRCPHEGMNEPRVGGHSAPSGRRSTRRESDGPHLPPRPPLQRRESPPGSEPRRQTWAPSRLRQPRPEATPSPGLQIDVGRLPGVGGDGRHSGAGGILPQQLPLPAWIRGGPAGARHTSGPRGSTLRRQDLKS